MSDFFSLLHSPTLPSDLVYVCKQKQIRPTLSVISNSNHESIKSLPPSSPLIIKHGLTLSFSPFNLLALFLTHFLHYVPFIRGFTPFKNRICSPSHLCWSMIPPSPFFLLTCLVPSVTTRNCYCNAHVSHL